MFWDRHETYLFTSFSYAFTGTCLSLRPFSKSKEKNDMFCVTPIYWPSDFNCANSFPSGGINKTSIN